MVAFYDTAALRTGKTRYMLCVPMTERPTAQTSFSIAQAMMGLTEDFDFALSYQVGNCHVDDARNQHVSRFLRSDCDFLVFIDSDIYFEPKALRQLLSAPARDIVGCSYPYKEDTPGFPCHILGNRYEDEEGLVEVEGLPTGFLRISRACLEDLSGKVESYYSRQEPGSVIPELFKRGTNDGIRYGGDIGFGLLAREHGYASWLLPRVSLGHTGSKTWHGSFYNHQSFLTRGVWPTVGEALVEDEWENDQLLRKASSQWGNESHELHSAGLQTIVRSLRHLPQGEVLEFGSGLSTLFMAPFADHVYALEQDRAWMGKTWGIIDDAGHNLRDKVTFLNCQTSEGRYYISKEWDDKLKAKKFSLILVDGPKGQRSLQSTEYDAHAWIFDDANRPDVQAAILELEKRGMQSHLVTGGKRPLVVVRNV